MPEKVRGTDLQVNTTINFFPTFTPYLQINSVNGIISENNPYPKHKYTNLRMTAMHNTNRERKCANTIGTVLVP